MVVEGVVFGVAAAISWGLADYVTAVIARRSNPFAVLIAAHVGGITLMTAVLVAALDVPAMTGAQFAAMVVLGPLSVVTYVCLFKGLHIGPVAIVSPILAAWAVVTLVLAIVLLAEPLPGSRAAGAALILGGVLLAATGGRAAGALPAAGTGVAFALAAMLGLGVYNFALAGLAKELGWFLPLFVSRTAGVVVMGVLVAVRGTRPWAELTKGQLALAALIPGVIATAGTLAFSRGAELGYVSITAAAGSIYPVIPIAMGVLLLGERVARHQAAGLVAILAGLVVLGASE